MSRHVHLFVALVALFPPASAGIPHRFRARRNRHIMVWRQGINQYGCEMSPLDQVLDRIKSRYEKIIPRSTFHTNLLSFITKKEYSWDFCQTSAIESQTTSLTSSEKLDWQITGSQVDIKIHWNFGGWPFPSCHICCVTCPHLVAILRNRPFWVSFMVSFP